MASVVRPSAEVYGDWVCSREGLSLGHVVQAGKNYYLTSEREERTLTELRKKMAGCGVLRAWFNRTDKVEFWASVLLLGYAAVRIVVTGSL